jgi:hypothetical protein
MNFSFDQATKTRHFDRNEPTILLFRFLLRNRSVHGAENFLSSHGLCAKKPLFDLSETRTNSLK